MHLLLAALPHPWSHADPAASHVCRHVTGVPSSRQALALHTPSLQDPGATAHPPGSGEALPVISVTTWGGGDRPRQVTGCLGSGAAHGRAPPRSGGSQSV